ncbi:DUF624 domain-containing protein [Cohnella lubricantis]|uniref:DUF624 domain-containing protein n=1 Tax=Cohnella lubricantis TaxID=2163172 RepID=A0A841TFI8_9BACL|nr:DUF624 domain-containing protein [Cohnella lubricantis]MBB6678855.1 DUF624 domain-containing protein [Cohnella lubricantis]MBP2118242.1 putative membrane protein YesL [Cohnella lubricantis]
MEMRGMMGGFYKISEWIMRLAVTNVLWVLLSCPVWLVVFMYLSSNTATEAEATGLLVSSSIVLAIVSPFTLFPATSAMFSVVRKWVMGETDVPLFRTYFRNYKQNYVQAMLGGIVYSVLFAILVVDMQMYSKHISGFGVLGIVFLAFIVLLIVSLFHFFSLLAHFHMKTLQIMKNSLILTIGRPLRTLSTAILSAFAIYISFAVLNMFLLFFFTGTVIALIAFFNFYQTIQKMQAKAEANAGADEIQLDDSAARDKEESDRSV